MRTDSSRIPSVYFKGGGKQASTGNRRFLGMVAKKQPPPVRLAAAGVIALVVVSCLLTAGVNAKRRKVNFKFEGEPVEEDIADRGLLQTKIGYDEVVTENYLYCKNVTKKWLNGFTLGYVTPWNPRGYKLAEKFFAKFTHISPVWYRIVWSGHSVKLLGQGDVDIEWVRRLQERGIWVVPRFVMEGLTPEQIMAVFKGPEISNKIVYLIRDEVVAQQYDGCVVEMWSAIAYTGMMEKSVNFREAVFSFFQYMGYEIRMRRAPDKSQLRLILPVPPAGKFFKIDWLKKVNQWTDGLQVMTYDYGLAKGQAGGPNAPLSWVKEGMRELLPPALRDSPRKRNLNKWEKAMGLKRKDVPLEEQIKSQEEAIRIMTELDTDENEEKLKKMGEETEQLQKKKKKKGKKKKPIVKATPAAQDNVVQGITSHKTLGTPGSVKSLMMGINFYGYEYEPDSPPKPIIGHDVVKVLEHHRPQLKWDSASSEHVFDYVEDGTKWTVWYPTPYSLALRLHAAQELGVGIAIWELGQGLDYFFDLL